MSEKFDSKWLNDFYARQKTNLPNPTALPDAEQCERQKALNKWRKWSPDDVLVLKSGYERFKLQGYTRISELAKLLGRTCASVVSKAGKLGIRPSELNLKSSAPKIKNVRTVEEIEAANKLRSLKQAAWHLKNQHPMLGKEVPQSVRDKISKANKGREVPREITFRQLKTKLKKYGTLAPPRNGTTWKAAWRTIGGIRKFYRSRWEANYARYLEWQKQNEIIKEWKHECETFWFESILRGCVSYLPDFKVTTNSDLIEYHEVKGWMDAASKTKIKRMAKYHPNINLRIFDSAWYKSNAPKLSKIIKGWE